MNKWPWIKESGEVALDQCPPIVDRFAGEEAELRYLAFHSDRFSAGFRDTLSAELTETLLELRVFSPKAELRLIRTSLGESFQYRIADDDVLKKNVESLETSDLFLKDASNYVLKSRQVLDINDKYPPFWKGEKDAKGCLLLCTTGGGHYALPIQPGDDVAVVENYLKYDEKTGVAGVADTRLVGFEKWKEADPA